VGTLPGKRTGKRAGKAAGNTSLRFLREAVPFEGSVADVLPGLEPGRHVYVVHREVVSPRSGAAVLARGREVAFRREPHRALEEAGLKAGRYVVVVRNDRGERARDPESGRFVPPFWMTVRGPERSEPSRFSTSRIGDRILEWRRQDLERKKLEVAILRVEVERLRLEKERRRLEAEIDREKAKSLPSTPLLRPIPLQLRLRRPFPSTRVRTW